MTTILGSGAWRYEVVEGWGRLPEGWSFREVAAICVDDARDRVYIFSRGQHPMTVFNRAGDFLTSWGYELFKRPHGLSLCPDGSILCTDDGNHSVRRCTPEGKVLLEIGTPGQPKPYMSGEPFCRCTHTALSPEGDIYVSDGYGNPRVHKFDPAGRLLFSWGESGCDPGQFNIPHNIATDAAGYVYVADRENHRVQVFDGKGRYQTQWNNLHRPSALFMTRGACPHCYIGETGPGFAINCKAPNLGPRVAVCTMEGKVLARLGAPTAGTRPDQFISPHGIAVDERGDIYVGEVSMSAWARYDLGPPPAEGLPCLKKLRKLPAE